jgi:hypothetical protein
MAYHKPTDADRAQAIAKARAGDLLTAWEFAAILRIDWSRFYRRHRTGAYEAFQVKPQIGPLRFSGVVVSRYLDGEPVFQRTFGRKRA